VNESKKRSIIIAIPMLLIGGTEIQTIRLVRVLISANYQVRVCCYYEYNPIIVSMLEDAGAEVILMDIKRYEGMLLLISRLRAIFRNLKPDVVHVQYVAPGLLPVIAARFAYVKAVFATVHQPGRVYGWKEKIFLRTAARLCTVFFCNSKAVEESWFGDSEIFNPEKEHKNRKHFTIYNAVDVDHIEKIIQDSDPQKIRNDLGLNDKAVIGVVGRLRREKGQDILLEAMPEIIRAVPNVNLLVIGDGPDRMSLELRAKSLGLESNILWLGQKAPNEVFQLYSIMDVVAVPSRFEGFGLSAAEAMAARIPVVASAVDGLMEVIEDGVSGWLFPVGESKKLVLALVDLLSNKQKAIDIANRGKENIRKKFSMENFTSSTISVYQYFIK
jgi:glycosyltransferase involved in cell wall biosynthesis